MRSAPSFTVRSVRPRPERRGRTGRRPIHRGRQRLGAGAERALLAVGIACLAWWGATGLRAEVSAARAVRRLETMTGAPDGLDPGHGRGARRDPHVSVGDPLGWIAIPRLGVRSVIVEGDDDLTLSFAAGHVPGTALPGAPGNAALAGHRDSVFSGLAHVRDGDVVLVTTPSARYRYVVSSTEVVGPDDVSALDAGGGTSLTLITCFPFRYVGPAPRRYVVRARLAPGEVSGEARTPRVNGSS